MIEQNILNFVSESNKIEGIKRDPTTTEIDAFISFMSLNLITIKDLCYFVSICEPNARLRNEYGLNVRIGRYYPPFGGPDVVSSLENILLIRDPFLQHVEYEKLHPFTDCNGRSGRALWAWNSKDLSLGFLHRFYYQALEHKGIYEKN